MRALVSSPGAQTHAGKAAGDQAAAPRAHARSRTPKWPMAQGECAGPLQLRGTGEHRQSRRIPGSVDWAMVADTSPPKPETPAFLEAYSRSGFPMAP